ncbi:unnamed protein product [Rotaria sp. Silwood1]|nr:unnamed protein product [Rotaria sp. Silwood1]CAF0864599.1 unnamed protein product [Rotaria sp. Silwood1]CAF3365595.1 unnamed protein product [Rotaria sp. Silwood1]CAF3381548.1 unnamed protein product [Rotaria sp. Silwood1]CAF3388286.1 unnamed protein product [Rotaria sp. Silwood1]
MENEYTFNYDEVKRIFESVPQTNSTKKKTKSIPYKTRFQARTKLPSIIKNDEHLIQTRSNTNSLMTSQLNQTSRTISFTLQSIRVYQIMQIEQFCFHTQHDFYVISNIIQ